MEKQTFDKAKELVDKIEQLIKEEIELMVSEKESKGIGIPFKLYKNPLKIKRMEKYVNTKEIELTTEELRCLIKSRTEKIKKLENELEKL